MKSTASLRLALLIACAADSASAQGSVVFNISALDGRPETDAINF